MFDSRRETEWLAEINTVLSLEGCDNKVRMSAEDRKAIRDWEARNTAADAETWPEVRMINDKYYSGSRELPEGVELVWESDWGENLERWYLLPGNRILLLSSCVTLGWHLRPEDPTPDVDYEVEEQ